MNGKRIISDFEYMEGGTFECYPPLFCDAPHLTTPDNKCGGEREFREIPLAPLTPLTPLIPPPTPPLPSFVVWRVGITDIFLYFCSTIQT